MDWIPEAKPPSGGLAAEGFYRLLGRPRLDPLTVLVRETAQNSWDARLHNDEPVQFGLQGWTLTDSERKALREVVFVHANKVRGSGLRDALRSKELIGLFITDRNTKGLGGPPQADQTSPDDTYDWVDFVLNVGEANTQAHTGGTYGFGKTISYVVSDANAIVIYSRTRYKGRIESRLIACAIGQRFNDRKKRFTGRHWWGVNRREAPLPLTGPEADRIAASIGMPSFGRSETGTNILVVAPDFGGRTPEQAMRFIAETVTWNLWPKLMTGLHKRVMDVYVQWNGVDVSIPRPEERPPLHGFAQAFAAVLDADQQTSSVPGLRIDAIRCQRPKVDAGLLATVPLIHRDRVHVDDGSDPADPEAPAPAAAIVGVCHHVALLRTPELVVDYLEGPAPPEGGTEWAGVFRASDTQDAHFAAAEPPTHDSWNPELLPKSHGRTIVRVSLREIATSLASRWVHREKSGQSEVASTALVADELAHLLGAVEGRGIGGPEREKVDRVPTPRRRAKIESVDSGPREWNGQLVSWARFRVTPAKSSTTTVVNAEVAAALDGRIGDASLDPHLRLVEARINGRREALSTCHCRLVIDGREEAEVELLASREAETTVLFDVALEEA